MAAELEAAPKPKTTGMPNTHTAATISFPGSSENASDAIRQIAFVKMAEITKPIEDTRRNGHAHSQTPRARRTWLAQSFEGEPRAENGQTRAGAQVTVTTRPQAECPTESTSTRISRRA